MERAWEIVARHYGKDSPAALAAQRFGLRFMDVDSERILSAQEALVREAFGSDSLDYAEVLSQHCLHRLLGREYAAAEPLCRQAEMIYEKAPDSASAQLASAHDLEGDALLNLGQPGEALVHYEKALAVRLTTFAPTYVVVLHNRLKIARARCLDGDIALASHEFTSRIDEFVAQVGPHHLWEAIHAARFADCLLDAGRVDDARNLLKRHGSLDPPREDMTEQDRAEVVAVWRRLPEDGSG